MVKPRGFTLIELVIVIAIVAILTLIAMPSYSRYVIRSQRVNLQSELIKITQLLEAYRTEHQSYGSASLAALYGTAVFPRVGTEQSISSSPLYDLRLTVANNGSGYVLVAIPRAGSSQARDGILVIDDQGQRCWSQTSPTCTGINNTATGWSHR